MDTEELIYCVHSREPLWNTRHKEYRNRALNETLWTEVAREMNVKSHKVKSKWKGLRDTFRKEFLKLKKNAAVGAKNACQSKWTHYKKLIFLTDSMTNHNPSRNQGIISEVSIEFVDNDSSQEVDKIKTEDDYQQHNTEVLFENKLAEVTDRTQRVKRRKISVHDPVLKRKENKSSFVKDKADSNNDSEYQFLVSLWPYLSQVQSSRRLVIRQKLQSVLVDELSRGNLSPSSLVAQPTVCDTSSS